MIYIFVKHFAFIVSFPLHNTLKQADDRAETLRILEPDIYKAICQMSNTVCCSASLSLSFLGSKVGVLMACLLEGWV